MKIFNDINQIKIPESTLVALGNFDGIHIGHQELIRRAVANAKIAGFKSAVFTFTNHPKNVTSGKTVVKNIISREKKIKILSDFGVDYLICVDFTPEFRIMEPKEFITEILIEKLNMIEAYCGFNYKYGKNAKGDVTLLTKIVIEKGIGLHVLEPYKIDGEIVSSTLIRTAIVAGDMEKCQKYLGRPYSIMGNVLEGNKIGRSIGFPTVNIILDDTMVMPHHGVYVTYTLFDGMQYASITNVGVKPTIGDNIKTIETYIFDFEEVIYGKQVIVRFVKKLRDEIKFESMDALTKQIGKDCNEAKDFHKKVVGEGLVSSQQ